MLSQAFLFGSACRQVAIVEGPDAGRHVRHEGTLFMDFVREFLPLRGV
jgi:hypothetical protein